MHQLESEFQSSPQRLRIVLPLAYNPRHKYRVIYVLPVEARGGTRFGDGLELLRGLDAHNRYNCILAQPDFSEEPWYVDHPGNPSLRQSTYMQQSVIPFVERTYSTCGGRAGRLLFGFSKSGWGAFSLLIRSPDFYGYAAAWDAPFFLDSLRWGMPEVFGDMENFSAYRPDRLLADGSGLSGSGRARLVLGGEKLWGTLHDAPGGRSHTVAFHELLTERSVPHVYRSDLSHEHTWNAGWAEPMLAELMRLADAGETPAAP